MTVHNQQNSNIQNNNKKYIKKCKVCLFYFLLLSFVISFLGIGVLFYRLHPNILDEMFSFKKKQSDIINYKNAIATHHHNNKCYIFATVSFLITDVYNKLYINDDLLGASQQLRGFLDTNGDILDEFYKNNLHKLFQQIEINAKSKYQNTTSILVGLEKVYESILGYKVSEKKFFNLFFFQTKEEDLGQINVKKKINDIIMDIRNKNLSIFDVYYKMEKDLEIKQYINDILLEVKSIITMLKTLEEISKNTQIGYYVCIKEDKQTQE